MPLPSAHLQIQVLGSIPACRPRRLRLEGVPAAVVSVAGPIFSWQLVTWRQDVGHGLVGPTVLIIPPTAWHSLLAGCRVLQASSLQQLLCSTAVQCVLAPQDYNSAYGSDTWRKHAAGWAQEPERRAQVHMHHTSAVKTLCDGAEMLCMAASSGSAACCGRLLPCKHDWHGKAVIPAAVRISGPVLQLWRVSGLKLGARAAQVALPMLGAQCDHNNQRGHAMNWARRRLRLTGCNCTLPRLPACQPIRLGAAELQCRAAGGLTGSA